ncbi:MAG: hypothetical protein COB49_08235 [Alphaproteobacteria bacterium]|nr:MAG: hypothetical protein COB49_08235 [Alphaproteobacteria bacterium]
MIRQLYKITLIFILSIWLLACQQATDDCSGENCDISNSLSRLPVVGLVQNKTIPILIKAANKGRARVEYRKTDDDRTMLSPWFELIEANDYTANLNLIDIADNEAYQYRVEFSAGDYSPWYEFTSFPKVGSPGKFSFVFSACLREKYLSYDIFSQIRSLSPTFVALTGDQMYADYDGNLNLLESYLSNDKLRQSMIAEGKTVLQDKTVLAAFRSKYARNFGTAYQNLSSHIPMLAMWDDHDFGKDNSDGTYPYKQQARKAFVENFPANPYVEENKGLYYRFSVADVDIFVLDTRWYRSPMQNEDNKDKHMLGPKQLSWLLAGLKASNSKMKLIFSSVSLNDYGGDTSSDRPGFDNWAGFKYERNLILSYIKNNDVNGVLFFSGDQHYPSAYIINKKASLKPLMRAEKFVEYAGKDVGTAVFDFSASPLSYEKASVRALDPANHFSYEIFRPEWAYPQPGNKKDAPKVVGSVYGVAEIDTTTSPATASIKFYELNTQSMEMEEIFHTKINM